VTIIDLPRVRSAIADAEIMLSAARSYVFSAMEGEWRKIETDELLTEKERSDVWLSRITSSMPPAK
jgi:alkylation response protein AidB-like acyl-CoA dehydrogenase